MKMPSRGFLSCLQVEMKGTACSLKISFLKETGSKELTLMLGIKHA